MDLECVLHWLPHTLSSSSAPDLGTYSFHRIAQGPLRLRYFKVKWTLYF